MVLGKLKCIKQFRLPEKNYVPPSWTLPMEPRRFQTIFAFEQANGRVSGLVARHIGDLSGRR